jgi:hypothetical protein
MLVARNCWALVTAARKEKGGGLASPNLKDSVATSETPKVEISTSVVEARKHDEDARRSGKGGAMLAYKILDASAAGHDS